MAGARCDELRGALERQPADAAARQQLEAALQQMRGQLLPRAPIRVVLNHVMVSALRAMPRATLPKDARRPMIDAW